MKKALVRPDSNRVFEVQNSPFEVAAPLFWVDCPDDATPATHLYDGTNVVAKPGPTAPELAEAARVAEIDQHIFTDAAGTPPLTLAQLAALNWTDFNTWWTNTVTSQAAANAVLKRVVYYLLRRVKP